MSLKETINNNKVECVLINDRVIINIDRLVYDTDTDFITGYVEENYQVLNLAANDVYDFYLDELRVLTIWIS